MHTINKLETRRTLPVRGTPIHSFATRTSPLQTEGNREPNTKQNNGLLRCTPHYTTPHTKPPIRSLLTLGHIVPVSWLLLLLHLLAAAFGGTIQRVLKCPIGELFVVPVERVPKGPILDTVAHVVDIHFEGKRLEAVYATERKPE